MTYKEVQIVEGMIAFCINGNLIRLSTRRTTNGAPTFYDLQVKLFGVWMTLLSIPASAIVEERL